MRRALAELRDLLGPERERLVSPKSPTLSLDLTGADVRGAILRNADLRGALLAGVDLNTTADRTGILT